MITKFFEGLMVKMNMGLKNVQNLYKKYRIYFIGGALGLVIIAVIVALSLGGPISSGPKQEVSMNEPVDIVLDFYGSWLSAAQATSTDPYQLRVADEPLLSKTLRERLLDMKEAPQDGVDPVLCQTTVPTQISALPVYERDETAQFLVMSREEGALEQAIITLTKQGEGWYIEDILCSPGEFPPEREFSFQMEGFLLKSVPPPLNPEYWHIVFEENNETHVAPLYFSAESICTNLDGGESVCSPQQFSEPSRALVSGQMTERGVDVNKLELK